MRSLKQISGVVVLICFLSGSVLAEEGGVARAFWWKPEYLDLAKQKWLAGDVKIAIAVNNTLNNANYFMVRGPYSVMDKDEIPPSGDKHDFLNYGSYWWPNPDTNDGLPWIHRDGYDNPDNLIDFNALNALRDSILCLSLAYYFTGNESYAVHAAYLLRVFFLDEETLMYPRILYAQVIPGVSSGTCDVPGFANAFQFILDGAGILECSPAWSQADKQGFQQWCQDLLNFMETEPLCDYDRNNTANHGTNYDFLAASLALYIGDEVKAREKILNYIENRMPLQIAADGSNPREMVRPNNLMYHCYNMQIMLRLASLADNFDDIDMWNYEMADGRGLRLALEFLVPYMTGQKEWTYWPGESFPPTYDRYFIVLQHGAVGYDSYRLVRYAQELNYWHYYINLIYPWFAITPAHGDFEPDGDVDLHDFAILASAWLSTPGDNNWNSSCDVSDPNDNTIDLLDLMVFSENWLDFR